MGDTAEYNRLVHDKANAQSRLNSAARKRDAIQEEIARLETAKEVLTEQYESFSDVKKTVKREAQQNYEWKGINYNQFAKHYGSALIDANQTYHENLDDARDEINLKISELENQLYEQEGILGQLRSLINSLAHRIENFFND